MITSNKLKRGIGKYGNNSWTKIFYRRYIGKRHYIELKSKLSEIIENILRDAPNG